MYQESGKRIFDIVVGCTLIIVTAPLCFGIAALVRLYLGRPILFQQIRPGLNGQPFVLYKFRTMTNERDSSGTLLPDADRLTGLGRSLRSTSLDELPELFNVLTGDMSLVGPRPLLTEYLEHYSSEHARRHEVRPGITGWAQVNGRNAIDWEQKFAYDVWYVENLGFWLDLRILIMTLWQTIKREGISQEGHATVDKFIGE